MIINDVEIQVDLETILIQLRMELADRGIEYLQKMKSTGRNVMVCCPYHGERRPSAGISKETGVFHCFACGEVHSLSEVISHCFGKEDYGKYGWHWLQRNYGSVERSKRNVKIDMGLRQGNLGNQSTNNRGSDVCNDNKRYVDERELDSYRYVHPYMYERKLTDEIIEKFDIGYDVSTECLTFSIRDASGNVITVARRSVNRKWFNYPQGVEKPVYGLYEVFTEQSNPKEIIICESMLDALTCWVYGKYAVALNGLGTDAQFAELRNAECRKYILATDNDDAGMKARKRIRKALPNKIITEYILPNGRKDINELSREEFDALVEVL